MSSFLSPLIKDPRGAYGLRNLRTGRVIVSSLEPAFEREARNRGLLGRTGLDAGCALVLAPCSSVHMFFMKFPIDVLFVNRDGRVRKLAHELRPWRLAMALGAFAAIETAAGVARASDTRVGDTLTIELVGN